MQVVEVLMQMGGVATRQQLVAATSAYELRAALRRGEVLADARGKYALASADEARRAAHRLSGTLILLSAALEHGWAVKFPPQRPQVSVHRSRKIDAERSAGVDLHRLRLDPDDIRDAVTTQDRTLLDCGRLLPDDEALCVFDSALRSGYSHRRLVRLAEDARGPGSRKVRRLAALADARAANPFESTLRAIALEVPGLEVRPQVPLYGSEFLGKPDLVDVDLRIVLEADSFAWHGGRDELATDARRYNMLVVHGWLVLRFAWEDVMHDPRYVRGVLTMAVALRRGQERLAG